MRFKDIQDAKPRSKSPRFRRANSAVLQGFLLERQDKEKGDHVCNICGTAFVFKNGLITHKAVTCNGKYTGMELEKKVKRARMQ